MGTKVELSVANNLMGDFEETHVYTKVDKPCTLDGFIGDIIMITDDILISFLDTTVTLKSGWNTNHQSVLQTN